MREWARLFLIAAGTLSLALGIVGIVVPLLPTTPFLLLSAFCYAKSSSKLHHWLLHHKWFGSYIKNWYAGKGIPLQAKILAVLSIVVSIGFSTVYIVPYVLGKILLVLIAIAVSVYIITRPTTLEKTEG